MKAHHLTTAACSGLGSLARFVAGFGLLAATGRVAAQAVGVLEYGLPGGSGPVVSSPVAVPTVGGASLILLSVILAFLSWRKLRRGSIRTDQFMVVALLCGAMASGAGGVRLVSDAMAQAGIFRDMTNPAGGSLEFSQQSGLIGCVRNATDVDLEVLAMNGQLFGIAVRIDPGCEISDGSDPNDNPACEVGMVLAPAEICGAFTGFTASDRRLKTDIVRVGVHESGLVVYEFRYINGTGRYRGVMAQDVLNYRPEAVAVMPNGYLAVDYRLLGVEMRAVP